MKYHRITFWLLAVTHLVFVVPNGIAENSRKSNTSDELAYIRARQKMLEGKTEEALPDLLIALKRDPESKNIHHELATAYMRLGKLDEAEAHGVKAVELAGDSAEYRLTLASIYASLKKYDQAKIHYSKVLELDPNNQKVPLLVAIVEAESGRTEDAVKTISKFIESNPENAMAYFYRAKIYLESDEVEKAKVDLDKSITLRPSFVEAGTALGMIYERLGDAEGAIAAYSKIQNVGQFTKRLAQLYLGKNDYPKALEELAKYEKLEPDDYTVRLKVGLILFELKRYQEALVKFNAILKEQKEATTVHFYIGLVYEEIKETQKAITAYKKVPTDASYFKESMLRVGFLLKEQNKIKEGREFARALLAKNPDVVEFYDLHATFYEAVNDYKKALQIIAEGRKKHPEDEKLLYFEGALFDKVGDRQRAIENMKGILAKNPNHPHALNFLGYTYAEMGQNLDEALNYVNKALEIRPNDGYIMDSLAWVYFKKGDLEKAQDTLTQAHALQPEEPIILEHLGDVAQAKSQVEQAVEWYKKALALSQKRKDVAGAKKLQNKVFAAAKESRSPSQTQSN